jgi:hypothetical protein
MYIKEEVRGEDFSMQAGAAGATLLHGCMIIAR